METRHIHGLRHVPLLLLLSLEQRKDIKDATIQIIPDPLGGKPTRIAIKHAIANVIRRPDEMMELVALYWLTKKATGNKIPTKMSDRQLRDGLALAFGKFNSPPRNPHAYSDSGVGVELDL